MPGFFDIIFGQPEPEPEAPKPKKVKKAKKVEKPKDSTEMDALRSEVKSLKSMMPLFTRRANEKPEPEPEPEPEVEDEEPEPDDDAE